MLYLRRLLALLTPTPFAGIVSILAALGVGYLLWAELEPAPRHVAILDTPEGTHMQTVAAFSPDGRSLVVYHFVFREMSFEKASLDLYDIVSGKHLVLAEGRDLNWIIDRNGRFPPFWRDLEVAFSPDGKKIAGGWLDAVVIWDRDSGAELTRYPIKTAADLQKPSLAFLSADLVLSSNGAKDEKGIPQTHRVALNSNKPWTGNEADFDRAHEEQQSVTMARRSSASSADGNRILSFVRSRKPEFIIHDGNGKPVSSIAIPWQLEIARDWEVGISPDGKTLVLQGTKWLPVRTAYGWLSYAFSNAAPPEPTRGTALVDVDSGAEIAFLHRNGIIGFAPDGKSLVLMEPSETDPGSIRLLAVYDWPLAKPWWRIAVGAAIAFLALVLFGKAWHWLRGTRKPTAEDEPRTKPPWETEVGAADPQAEVS